MVFKTTELFISILSKCVALLLHHHSSPSAEILVLCLPSNYLDNAGGFEIKIANNENPYVLKIMKKFYYALVRLIYYIKKAD